MPENYQEFLKTLENDFPKSDWPEALKSLWYDAKGDWEASHNIAQDMYTEMGSWIHAYLHRKEGDKFNAGYWYRQAGKKYPNETLAEEQEQMVAFILEN
ncbi:MAG: hypothetical protein AB8B59_08430 [Maribacter sp.]